MKKKMTTVAAIATAMTLTGIYNETDAQNVWTQKASFSGTARSNAVGFSIGTKGYIGTGVDGSGYRNDFWEYDPSTNTWTQKANFGGTTRSNAVGFSMGTKGYIGTGVDGSGYRNDFWEYDPAANTWTQKASFGGMARAWGVGFSIGTKGYIGTGYNAGTYYNDFWEYDPATNTWTQKANFGGTGRYYAVGFSIGTKGYIGTGIDGIAPYYKNDFWEYAPTTGINSLSSDNILIAPNPAKDLVQFTASPAHLGGYLRLYDTQGKEILSVSVRNTSDNKFSVESLPAGVYYYQISNSAGEVHGQGKLIVAR